MSCERLRSFYLFLNKDKYKKQEDNIKFKLLVIMVPGDTQDVISVKSEALFKRCLIQNKQLASNVEFCTSFFCKFLLITGI